MSNILLVALGGGIGAATRYQVGKWAFHFTGPGFPWGTLIANVLGGFLMGMLVGWLATKVSGGESLRLFLGVGLLGGFTTFSAFSLETMKMIETKSYALAGAYIGGSVMLSILAVFIGLFIARKLFAV